MATDILVFGALRASICSFHLSTLKFSRLQTQGARIAEEGAKKSIGFIEV